jgi:hypothetical protein
MTLTFSLVPPNDRDMAEIWEQRLGRANPECSMEHLHVLMACEPHKEHHFVVGKNQRGDVLAIAYLAIQLVDALGLRLRVLTLGGSTGTDALWFDGDLVPYGDVVRELLHFTKKHISHSLVVLKPFDGTRDLERLRTNEKELSFINVYGTTQADVSLSAVDSYDAYLALLDKKKRYYLKKVEKDAESAGLSIEVTADFAHLVPALYPLFQSVSARAREVKDLDPIPSEYLDYLAEAKALNPQAIIVRTPERIVGFMMLVEKGQVLCCGVCGMDHSVSKIYNTWYLLMLHAIKYGIASKMDRVILGTTNFSMKRKLGARRYDLWVSLRFTSRWLTVVLAPVIRMWLRRNLFTGADGHEGVDGVDASVVEAR